MKAHETRTRSLVKAIIWRLVATTFTWIVMFFFTQDVWGSLGGTLAAGVLGTIGYYFNERVWNHIHWGRHAK
ncbi:DUF2061 domain-containing protein [Patescibacteria group bacterium]|nr:DUF2061 domain-containing protein [Patescibacteria group bacterium]